LLAVALGERHGLLVDQLGDSSPQLDVGGGEVGARQIAQIDAVDQLAVDAKLQVLEAALRRRRARAADDAENGVLRGVGGWRGLLREAEAIAELHACTPSVRANSRRKSRPVLGLAAATPATFAASSVIARASLVGLPLSGAPWFMASPADASSRGITKNGCFPIARDASWRLTGPGTASVTSTSTCSSRTPSRPGRPTVP